MREKIETSWEACEGLKIRVMDSEHMSRSEGGRVRLNRRKEKGEMPLWALQ